METSIFLACLAGAIFGLFLLLSPAAFYLLYLSYKTLLNIEKVLSLQAKYLYEINYKFPELDLSETEQA